MSSHDASSDTQQPSAAERFRAAKKRNAFARTSLGEFTSRLGFELDDFQREACQFLEQGHSVLVAAPTGAGKTVPGEFAIHLALEKGQKAFYTTPIKALSNQKYSDLVEVYGSEKIGLLTGDVSRNSNADIVVMTTEVLRNMLYADSDTLTGLSYVVMDEVHYLADRFRGAVWEEVIIHLPEHVQVVALSATVSNAEEFGAWLNTVRGDTSVVVSEHRPVPLWQHVMAGKKLYDLFSSDPNAADNKVNPELAELIERQRRETQPSSWGRSHRGSGRRGPRHRGRGRRWDRGFEQDSRQQRRSHHKAQDLRTSRPAMIRELQRQELLPVIGFIFSRAGCEAAVEQCLAAGLDLTTKQQKRQIELIVDQAAESLPPEDREILGFWAFRDGLRRGFAAHHAGMLPAFKEVVEELFAGGLIKAVFATETLALGINMPARTVVLEKLVKFNGEAHVDITPGEYTQLTGRAGRRGIDVEGHAVVMWQPRLDPSQVAGLASRRTYPLNSSFKPTYNMSANLLSQYGRERTRGILESSFAQFQADRSVVGLAQELRSMEKSLASYEDAMQCHLGDFVEYATLRSQLTDAEKSSSRARNRAKRRAIMESLNQLIPGDIFTVRTGRRLGDVVVVSPAGNPTNPRVGVVTAKGQLRRVSIDDLNEPVQPEYGVKLPKKLRIKTPTERKNIAAWMREAIADERPVFKPQRQAAAFRYRDEGVNERVTELRRELHLHPCHGCPDREDHWRWATRWNKLRKDADVVQSKISGRTNTIARTFDRITQLLEQFGYVEGDTITERGQALRRIYGERDLLSAMLLEEEIVDEMSPEDLAGLAALLVFDAASEELDFQPSMPTETLQEALEVTDRLWYELQDAEARHKLAVTPQPNPGLVWPIMRWTRGQDLIDALHGSELAAGDFVRWARQVIDVLDQFSKLDMHPDLARRCSRAKDLVDRGIVAYSSMVHTPDSALQAPEAQTTEPEADEPLPE